MPDHNGSWIPDKSKKVFSYLVYCVLFITGCVGHNVMGETKRELGPRAYKMFRIRRIRTYIQRGLMLHIGPKKCVGPISFDIHITCRMLQNIQTLNKLLFMQMISSLKVYIVVNIYREYQNYHENTAVHSSFSYQKYECDRSNCMK